MKKREKILGVLLAVVLLVGAVPAYAAGTTTGLNGDTCLKSDFDESVYDVIAWATDARDGKLSWPSSGNVLLKESGSNWKISDLNGVTIPAGLVVDFYQYYKFAGDADYTYKLVAHFDTTDGKAYTIGSSSNSNTGNTSSSSSSNSSTSSTAKQWGTVHKTFIPYNKPASYTHSYTDVSSNAWYYDAVMTVTEGGLLAGYGNGLAGPNDPLTRAQLGIIQVRLTHNKLSDNYWESTTINGYHALADNATATRAFAAIALAGGLPVRGTTNLTSYELSLVKTTAGVDGGLLKGISSSGNFGGMTYPVYDNWRASLSKDIDYCTSIDEFPDSDKIHQWIEENADLMGNVLILTSCTHDDLVSLCESYFLRAWNLGMFSGVDDKGTFDPYGAITRGQLCQVLYSMGWTTAKCLDYDS